MSEDMIILDTESYFDNYDICSQRFRILTGSEPFEVQRNQQILLVHHATSIPSLCALSRIPLFFS